jgi:hypothetical protein
MSHPIREDVLGSPLFLVLVLAEIHRFRFSFVFRRTGASKVTVRFGFFPYYFCSHEGFNFLPLRNKEQRTFLSVVFALHTYRDPADAALLP